MATLTQEQKDAVRGILKNLDKEPWLTLSGYAGTGKTVCVSVLKEVDRLANFRVCAYTGKAANVLRRRGVGGASTIHSLIYKPVTYEDGSVEFMLRMPSEVDADGFLVDEASMVSKDIHDALLTFGKPIIYIGDHGQLEPIGTDFNVMQEPMFRLEEVHRNAGPIAHFADHLRRGGNAGDFAGGEDKVYLATTRDMTDEHLVSTDQIIAAYNKFRCDMNDRVRRHKFAGQKVQQSSEEKKALDDAEWLFAGTDAEVPQTSDLPLVVVGERVMCLRNNKKQGLFNGMQAIVKKTHKKLAFFDIESDDGIYYKNIKYLAEQFGKEKNDSRYERDGPIPFDYAYCCTCHKAQGDEWQNVIVYEQMCDKWDHKRWAYTAASRAKNSLIWVMGKPARPKFVPEWLK